MLPKGLADTAEIRRIDFIGKFWIMSMTSHSDTTPPNGDIECLAKPASPFANSPKFSARPHLPSLPQIISPPATALNRTPLTRRPCTILESVVLLLYKTYEATATADLLLSQGVARRGQPLLYSSTYLINMRNLSSRTFSVANCSPPGPLHGITIKNIM